MGFVYSLRHPVVIIGCLFIPFVFAYAKPETSSVLSELKHRKCAMLYR